MANDEEDSDSAYSVDLLMDVESLEELLSRNSDDEIAFLIFWLRDQHTKAVIPKKGRDKFMDELEEKAKTASDIYRPIISFFRGYTTPYRFKYVTAAGISGVSAEQYNDDMPESQIITVISNWHYATVKYVIVKNPDSYRKANTIAKLRPECITDIDGFYKLISAEDAPCVKKFKTSLEAALAHPD